VDRKIAEMGVTLKSNVSIFTILQQTGALENELSIYISRILDSY
jgi:hypothetical protein